jgi:enamine deaminase RidA (YjgF/YER057c/UK114 family)
MLNVGAALAAAGAAWGDVFKLTLFVVDTVALPTVRRYETSSSMQNGHRLAPSYR